MLFREIYARNLRAIKESQPDTFKLLNKSKDLPDCYSLVLDDENRPRVINSSDGTEPVFDESLPDLQNIGKRFSAVFVCVKRTLNHKLIRSLLSIHFNVSVDNEIIVIPSQLGLCEPEPEMVRLLFHMIDLSTEILEKRIDIYTGDDCFDQMANDYYDAKALHFVCGEEEQRLLLKKIRDLRMNIDRSMEEIRYYFTSDIFKSRLNRVLSDATSPRVLFIASGKLSRTSKYKNNLSLCHNYGTASEKTGGSFMIVTEKGGEFGFSNYRLLRYLTELKPDMIIDIMNFRSNGFVNLSILPPEIPKISGGDALKN